jgi:hypothetical protein
MGRKAKEKQSLMPQRHRGFVFGLKSKPSRRILYPQGSAAAAGEREVEIGFPGGKI